MEKVVKVIARIEEEQRRRLYHVLLDERLSFSEWLRRQIDAYLRRKEVKAEPPRGKRPSVPRSKKRKGGRHVEHDKEHG